MARASRLLGNTSDGECDRCRDLDDGVDAKLRDAEGVEIEQPGERDKIQAVSDQFNRFQMMNFNEHMHCLRGTHLKTQGVNIYPILAVPKADRSSV